MMKAVWHTHENTKNSSWLLHKNGCFNCSKLGSAFIAQKVWCCLFFYVRLFLTPLDIRKSCNGYRMFPICHYNVLLWIYFSVIRIKRVGRAIYSQYARRKACKPSYSGSILTKIGMCCYILLDLSNIKFNGKVFSSFWAIQAGMTKGIWIFLQLLFVNMPISNFWNGSCNRKGFIRESTQC